MEQKQLLKGRSFRSFTSKAPHFPQRRTRWPMMKWVLIILVEFSNIMSNFHNRQPTRSCKVTVYTFCEGWDGECSYHRKENVSNSFGGVFLHHLLGRKQIIPPLQTNFTNAAFVMRGRQLKMIYWIVYSRGDGEEANVRLDTHRLRINFPFRWFRFSLRTWAAAALTWAEGERTWSEPEHAWA